MKNLSLNKIKLPFNHGELSRRATGEGCYATRIKEWEMKLSFCIIPTLFFFVGNR